MLMDAPGMGKTVTIEQAARDENVAYVSFQCGEGLPAEANQQLRMRLAAAAARNPGGTIRSGEARAIGVEVWTAVLVAGLRGVTKELRSSTPRAFMTGVSGGKVAWAKDWKLSAANAAKAALQDAIETRLPGLSSAHIVVHFDELQALFKDGIRILEGDPHDPPDHSTPDVCMRYTLVWLSEAMAAVFPAWIRPVLTGISSGMGSERLRTDSGLKRDGESPLPYFTAGMVKEVLRTCVTFTDSRVEDVIAAGAEGCPRAVQHVLRVLRNRAYRLRRGDTGMGVWTAADLLREARASWMRAGCGSFLQASEAHRDAAFEALLATTFPDQTGGTLEVVDGASVVCFRDAAIPALWRGASRAGVLRMQSIGDDRMAVFQPYPFMVAYLSTIGAHGTYVGDCMRVVARSAAVLRAFTHDNRCTLAVALELCMPGSRLSLAIAACPQLAALGLTPMASVAHLCPYRTAADLPTDVVLQSGEFRENPSVYVVAGGGTGAGGGKRPGPPGGLAVPFLRGGRVVLVLVEMSTGAARAADSDRVTRGLRQFVEACNAHAIEWPFACFICNEDPDATARSCMDDHNAAGAAATVTRAMGLVVLDDELVGQCKVNMDAVLRSEADLEGPTIKHRPLDWCRLLFDDPVRRREVAAYGAGAWGGDGGAAALAAFGVLISSLQRQVAELTAALAAPGGGSSRASSGAGSAGGGGARGDSGAEGGSSAARDSGSSAASAPLPPRAPRPPPLPPPLSRAAAGATSVERTRGGSARRGGRSRRS